MSTPETSSSPSRHRASVFIEYENGRLSAITDSAGRRTEIEIDVNGNLVPS